jgi:hypothetical protein
LKEAEPDIWSNYAPSLAQETPAELEGPAELGGAAPAAPASKSKINQWDGLIHNADGSKSFPDGTSATKGVSVNTWAQNQTPVHFA